MECADALRSRCHSGSHARSKSDRLCLQQALIMLYQAYARDQAVHISQVTNRTLLSLKRTAYTVTMYVLLHVSNQSHYGESLIANTA